MVPKQKQSIERFPLYISNSIENSFLYKNKLSVLTSAPVFLTACLHLRSEANKQVTHQEQDTVRAWQTFVSKAKFASGKQKCF